MSTVVGLPSDRAPQLRRWADQLMQLAGNSEFPDRVRRLARDMRIRAAELELEGHDPSGTREFAQEFRITSGFELLR
jgi:hypothetical protein